MRNIPLDGTKARYGRLKLLPEAETYGRELDPMRTAPFTVRFESGQTRVLLGETEIAAVSIPDEGPILQVANAYPQRFDEALLRAVRNAADLTDEVGKLKRAGKREVTGDAGIFTRTQEAFALPITHPHDMHKALLGVCAVEKKLSVHAMEPTQQVPYHRFLLRAQFGNARHSFSIHMLPEGPVTRVSEFNAYGLRAETFIPLLERGLREFEARVQPDAVDAACRALLAQSVPIDTTSLDKNIQRVPQEAEQRRRVFRSGALSAEGVGSQNFTLHRFNGVEISQGFVGVTLPAGVDVDHQLLKAAGQQLNIRWKAHVLGHALTDYPIITEDLIAAKIADVDFGYDL